MASRKLKEVGRANLPAALAVPGLGEAELALAAVGKGAEMANKALSTDLYVVRRKFQAGTKRHPVEVTTETHINGMGLILAGAATAGGLLTLALLSYTMRDRTRTGGLFNPSQFVTPGWLDAYNRAGQEAGFTRQPGQLLYHRPKKT